MAKNKTHTPPKKTTNKNAAQRLADLEKNLSGVVAMIQDLTKQTNEALRGVKGDVAHDINVLAGEIDTVSNQLKNLAVRSNLMSEMLNVKEKVDEAMLERSIQDLKVKVEDLVDKGVIVLDNSSPITDRTFVVGREVDKDGNETNARLQFAVASIDKALQDKLVGAKVGDTVVFEEDRPRFEPTEIYVIQEIKKEFTEEDLDKEDAAPEPQVNETTSENSTNDLAETDQQG